MSLRRGGALVAALALLALAAALLAGSFAAATAAQRSAQTHEAVLLADAEVRAAIAEFVSQWSAVDDSLAVGAERSVALGPRARGSGAVPMLTQLRLRRLSPTRFILAADCQAGPSDVTLARRRMRVILNRVKSMDSLAPVIAPVPRGRWTLSDLY